jgi:hypothetical protein
MPTGKQTFTAPPRVQNARPTGASWLPRHTLTAQDRSHWAQAAEASQTSPGNRGARIGWATVPTPVGPDLAF